MNSQIEIQEVLLFWFDMLRADDGNAAAKSDSNDDKSETNSFEVIVESQCELSLRIGGLSIGHCQWQENTKYPISACVHAYD